MVRLESVRYTHLASHACLSCSFLWVPLHFLKFGVGVLPCPGRLSKSCLALSLPPFPYLTVLRHTFFLDRPAPFSFRNLTQAVLFAWILFSLLFMHRTLADPSGLSCWASFLRKSSPKIRLDISLRIACIASCNFHHGNCPPVVITGASWILWVHGLSCSLLIWVPSIVPGAPQVLNKELKAWEKEAFPDTPGRMLAIPSSNLP